MSTKIDLDELDRKIRVGDYVSDGPSVVIALISRIREMEAVLYQVESSFSLIAPAQSAELRALLKKGAVIP